MVSAPSQMWNSLWPSIELLHDNLIRLGVFDHEF
jgi:hypothetical protein